MLGSPLNEETFCEIKKYSDLNGEKQPLPKTENAHKVKFSGSISTRVKLR